jgi:ABC-type glycerol-3-phosphate transport system permease component
MSATADHAGAAAVGGPLRWAPSLAVLAFLSLLSLFPFFFVAVTAFKTTRDYAQNPLGLPSEPTLEFMRRALTAGHVDVYLLNSLIVVVTAVILLVAISSLAGYALACIGFRGSNLVLLSIVCLLAVPAAVVMIPVYRTVGQLGMINTYPGLILTYTALNLPFSIYLMTSYFGGIPREILEAATIDGAGQFRQFRSIALPLARPALSTSATLNFLWLFNELLFALLILQDDEKRTLPVGLATLQGQHTTPVPLLASGLLISLIPVLLLFFFAQRHLARGLTVGAVK